MAGKVYLVGAGPGDPGLISLKAVELLKKADVIVRDHLVSEKLLSYAKKEAEIIYVGKEADRHTLPQDEISQLLVNRASGGKMIVRLKGGDPFIFGRGGEEALELAKNGIPFEVVPGISSAYAVPTYAGIPVTQRGFTSTVAFITGHEDPTKLESDIDWEKLSTGAGTLVFLMGVRNLPFIVEQLKRYGRQGNTPIALIRWGTLPKQEVLVGTLDNIVGEVEVKGFKPPAVIVVGEVVSLRDKLKWFEARPLFGRRIVVTRSRSQASQLVMALEELGAEVIELPTIKIVPPESYDELDAAIRKITTPNSELRTPNYYDWIIFTSVNGVDYFMERLKAQGKDLRELKGIKLAAIGPVTAKKLKELRLKIDFVPEEYRAEAIIEGLKESGVQGQRALIPRAKEAREVLVEGLKSLGVEVEVVVSYQTVADESAKNMAEKLFSEEKIDVVTFTSSSTVRNFVNLLEGIDLKKVLEKVKVACIGPVTAKTAEKLGLHVDIVAKEYTIPGLIEAITEAVG